MTAAGAATLWQRDTAQERSLQREIPAGEARTASRPQPTCPQPTSQPLPLPLPLNPIPGGGVHTASRTQLPAPLPVGFRV